jgi:hypothetical protein
MMMIIMILMKYIICNHCLLVTEQRMSTEHVAPTADYDIRIEFYGET